MAMAIGCGLPASPPPTARLSTTIPGPIRTDDAATSILSDTDFLAVSRLIHRDTGILITASKKSMLISRLSRRLRSLGLTDFADYVALLHGSDGAEERRALVSAVTTNVTGFFREPHHFRALADLGPSLVARARAGGRVRIWSAGCSTGQEAFSIAATLLAIAPDIARHDLRILATDIDPAVIETARAGIFDRRALGEAVPPDLHRLVKDGPGKDQITLAPSLHELIRFQELNLLQPWPFQGQFDVIFCRNVVIYFDAETRLDLWMRFAARMPKGGMLFIGHSERMDPRLDTLFTPVGITQYERSARTAAPGPAAAETTPGSGKG
ncbi:MAG: protein-glutamate O-methyltransferase CheR [Paracoccaceae bacterium]